MPASASTPPDAYVICATPRTGSTLLCRLLTSTGVAGKPESYFRAPDALAYARRWGVPVEPDGAFCFRDFVRAAITAGSTANGVFGVRVMWGIMDEVVAQLRAGDDEPSGSDLAVLERVFGATRWVYLHREDVVAQAVSWARAEQTGVWQDGAVGLPWSDPHFDFDMIDQYVTMARQHNAAWSRWFDAQGVSPLLLRYEDLVADVAGVASTTLEWLGLEAPRGYVFEVATRRQSDARNEEWIERYRAHSRSTRAARP